MGSPDSRKTARLLLYPMVILFVAALFLYLFSPPALQSGPGGAPEEAGAESAASSDGNFFLTQLSVEVAGHSDVNAAAAGTAGDGNFSLSVQGIGVREASSEKMPK